MSKVAVLLIEDNDADAFIMQDALDKASFESVMYHVTNGEEAISFLQDEENPKPDMIFLDLNMPIMGGHEFLSWIKEQDAFKRIPVGVLTTSSNEEDIKKAYESHASYYIVKPTSYSNLQDIVKAIQEFWFKTARLPKEAEE